jgi:hypothetical protein
MPIYGGSAGPEFAPLKKLIRGILAIPDVSALKITGELTLTDQTIFSQMAGRSWIIQRISGYLIIHRFWISSLNLASY